MEKTFKHIVLVFGLSLLMLSDSCAEDEMFITDAREITITAEMPGAGDISPEAGLPRKSVAVASDDNTLGLVTKWKDGDKIQIFVRQNGIVYKVDTPSTVYDISANGKTCAFKFNLPDAVNGDYAFDVIGVTGIDAQISGSQVVVTSKLKRIALGSSGEADSPMWCEVTIDKSSVTFNAAFKHLGTYEVLHVKNTSSSNISFKHSGFSAASKWYKATDNTVLCDTYDPSSTAASNGEAESEAVTIAAGGTGKILSWYIPSGKKVNEAKLNAVVGGKRVTTSDSKTSSITIERGKAYHMYITWNGSSLWFANSLVEIYVKASQAPHLYVWVYKSDLSGVIEPCGTWPGILMTQKKVINGVTFWYASFDYDEINIIFNNGIVTDDGPNYDYQTQDIVGLMRGAHFFTYDGGGGYTDITNSFR